MASVRPRLSIEENVWNAVEAVAKANGIHPSTFVERALVRALDSANEVAELSRMVRELSGNASAVNDKIDYLADYIVDRYRSEDVE